MDAKIHKQGKRYNTDAERRKGYLDAQLRYGKKEWICETCNIPMSIGNKWKHLKTKKHLRKLS